MTIKSDFKLEMWSKINLKLQVVINESTVQNMGLKEPIVGQNINGKEFTNE